MERPTAISAASAVTGPQHDPARRRAGPAPPPPGTYVPRLPPLSQPPGTGLATAAAATELSPAARRCLREIIGLLDRATMLLREQADGQPAPAAAASPRHVAVELAVAGHDRAAVRRRLAAQFALGDPGVVLDEVFGAGTPGHQRLPGAAPAT